MGGRSANANRNSGSTTNSASTHSNEKVIEPSRIDNNKIFTSFLQEYRGDLYYVSNLVRPVVEEADRILYRTLGKMGSQTAVRKPAEDFKAFIMSQPSNILTELEKERIIDELNSQLSGRLGIKV